MTLLAAAHEKTKDRTERLQRKIAGLELKVSKCQEEAKDYKDFFSVVKKDILHGRGARRCTWS